MIARLADGKMIPCPKQGRDGRGGLHMDLPKYYAEHPQRSAADGYYPVQFTTRPAGDRAMGWTLQRGRIVQTWTQSAPQPQDPILMRLERIEDCLQRISETIGA